MSEDLETTKLLVGFGEADFRALREPFPPESIGKLPKAGITLDYVGHAAVTDRLLKVDPHWSWEPLALDERGLPALDAGRNLWIRLTVCGVTRIGVGDGKSAKECIGDAIRNAAMRFGVALDLWSKEELEGAHGDEDAAGPPVRREPKKKAETGEAISKAQVGKIQALAGSLGLDRDARLAGIARTVGREVASSKDLTKAEASTVIEGLEGAIRRRDAEAQEAGA